VKLLSSNVSELEETRAAVPARATTSVLMANHEQTSQCREPNLVVFIIREFCCMIIKKIR
jgi:hypothetical protein